MCGIFGYSFKPGAVPEYKRGILTATLARLNDDRGGHSWGIVGVPESGAVDIQRGLGDLAPNSFEVAQYTTVYAHTRFATLGSIKIENAHPFEMGKIVGAHNGMVYNHKSLSDLYGRDFDVDSMHLFAHLDLDLDFGDINGYGAIEWINKDEPARIYLTRLNGGELSVWGIKDGKETVGVIWTSDEDHMTEALETSGIIRTAGTGLSAFEFDIVESEVFYVENYALFKAERSLELGFDSWVKDDTADDEAIKRWFARRALSDTVDADLRGPADERKPDSPYLWEEKDPFDDRDDAPEMFTPQEFPDADEDERSFMELSKKWE